METLVAVAILTVAIVGPFYAAQTAYNAANSARDELIASSLAQEAVEYVRSVRDDNYLYNVAHPSTPHSWLYGLDGTGGVTNCVGNSCTVDPTQSAVVACSGSCPRLYLSSANLYNQAMSGTQTPFTRSVLLTIVGNHEARLTVTVSWTSAHIANTVVITEVLENWL